MQFPCARCARTYEIADELVVGRAVKVACPACGNLAIHRVPAPGAAVAPPPSPPPAPGQASALFDADDDDFESALSALDSPAGEASAGGSSAAPARAPVAAPAPQRPAARKAAAPKPAAARAVRPPSPLEIPDDDVPTVTAELVIRRSARRSRMVAAAMAVVALCAVGGVGTMALKWKRHGPAGGGRGGAGSASGAGDAAGAVSGADLAKLMGRQEPEPPPAVRTAAPPPRAADRPKHEKLATGDKGLLDLLAKKGDVAVTVQDDDAAALATTRATLDSDAIEGTLSRNSSSFAACVSRAASSGPDQRLAANRVNLELTIRPSGRVQKAAVADKAVAGTPLGQCIAQAAKRMVFPGWDGEPIDIIVPLKLRVGF